jgi:hypothetical protein
MFSSRDVVPGDEDEEASLTRRSEVTPEGITETELGQTLLNGNNIAMVSRLSRRVCRALLHSKHSTFPAKV